MQKNRNQKRLALGSLAILILVVVSLVFLWPSASKKIKGYEKELNSFDRSISEENLEKYGYFNFSGVLEKRIGNFEQFFAGSAAGKKQVLKYFTKDESTGSLVAYILYHPKNSPSINVIERDFSLKEAASYKKLVLNIRAEQVDGVYEVRAAHEKTFPDYSDNETCNGFLLYKTKSLDETRMVVKK